MQWGGGGIQRFCGSVFYIPDTHCLCRVDFPEFLELCFLTYGGASSLRFVPLHPGTAPMNSRAKYSYVTPFHKVYCEGKSCCGGKTLSSS